MLTDAAEREEDKVGILPRELELLERDEAHVARGHNHKEEQILETQHDVCDIVSGLVCCDVCRSVRRALVDRHLEGRAAVVRLWGCGAWRQRAVWLEVGFGNSGFRSVSSSCCLCLDVSLCREEENEKAWKRLD